jgi:hypothetical protein
MDMITIIDPWKELMLFTKLSPQETSRPGIGPWHFTCDQGWTWKKVDEVGRDQGIDA